MNNFISPLSEQALYDIHSSITFVMLIIWLIVCIVGHKLKNSIYKRNITIFLISISLIQELFDYLNRFLFSDLYIVKIQTDLPLHLCHFAYWFRYV